MPRAPRIEFPGAVYHVLNRGNYRQDLFTIHRTGAAFEEALLETAERFNWKLHAYVVMPNHYHIAVETPGANLSTGMQWLQSVFANRFNQFRSERGHVFQGRFKALVVEPGSNLTRVIDYIHLNPVRAGLIRLEDLCRYRPSSFACFFLPRRSRPKCLTDSGWRETGGYAPGRRGVERYGADLAVKNPELLQSGKQIEVEFCRGWAIGGDKFKEQLLESSGDPDLLIGVDHLGTVRVDHERFWNDQATELIAASGHSESDVINDRKSADWKLEIATRLKAKTSVSNPWLARRLDLGHPSSASKNISEFRKRQKSKA